MREPTGPGRLRAVVVGFEDVRDRDTYRVPPGVYDIALLYSLQHIPWLRLHHVHRNGPLGLLCRDLLHYDIFRVDHGVFPYGGGDNNWLVLSPDTGG